MSNATPNNGNIFAEELEHILITHHKSLSSLFGLRVPDPRGYGESLIPPARVARLKQSLVADMSVTLNAEELAALQRWVPLDPDGDEMRHLRAALVAEGVRFQLSSRVDRDQAYQAGRQVLQLLTEVRVDSLDAFRQMLLDSVRHHPDVNDESWSDQDEEEDFFSLGQQATPTSLTADERMRRRAASREVYHHAMALLAVARDATDTPVRQGYAALATAALWHAQDLASGADEPSAPEMKLMETALAEAFGLL